MLPARSVVMDRHQIEVLEPVGSWPLADGVGRTIALCRVSGVVERGLCEAWARAQSASGSAVHVTWSGPEAVAAAAPEDAIVPVRVAWLGSGDHGRAHGLGSELLGSWARGRLQERQLARDPQSCRIVVGEPARLSELHSRWSERSGAIDLSGPEFAAFIERQADITLERTERQVRGDRYRAPRAVVEEVMTSPGFAERIDALSSKLGRSPDGVRADVRAYLDEMASEQNPLVVDLWARWSRFLYSRGYRVEVEPESLERIRELGRSHPLVFLPSHRSNLDPYVMASVLYENGLPQNHTLGGINMAFWPIGPLGRRVGVVFIRRSFRDNDIYRFVLERYLAFLVGKRFNLEWYVEGTRSRTGKLLPPKLGLLSYLLDAVADLDRDDVFAVPTAITYDLLPEVGEMTAESAGATKQAEGLRWLIRYARMQRGNLGAIHVQFGEPLNLGHSLRELAPKAAPASSAEGRLARSKIAFEVCNRINRATLITAPALLLFALLGAEDRALTLEEVRDVAEPVLAYATARRIPLDLAARDLATTAGVQRTLDFLVRQGVVECFDDAMVPVYRIGRAHELVAAFYRNSILHWFVTRAIVELVVLRVEREGAAKDPIVAGWHDALRLRDLLKFEFFFPDKIEFGHEMERELALGDPTWRDRAAGGLNGIGEALASSGMLVAHRTVRSFFEAYVIVADRLVQLGAAPAEPAQLIQDALALGRQYRLQRRVSSSEAVSAHLFGTAVKLAQHHELLGSGDLVLRARRAFADELHEVLGRVAAIHDLDRLHSGADQSDRQTG
jgi:glycerol-3-phosphate O-acyltransferase